MIKKAFIDTERQAVFEKEGYIILDLLLPEDVADLLACYHRFESVHESDFSATVLTGDLDARRQVHDLVSAVYRRRLLPVLDDYRIVLGSYAVKLPKAPNSALELHQDLSFVDEKAFAGISLLVPLVDVNAENGWLGVVRGSHLLNTNYREPCRLPYRELVTEIEDHYMTYLPMKPGQVLFMDNRVFHGSPANRSDAPRIVAAGVAVPEDCRLLYCHRDGPDNPDMIDIYEVPEDFYRRHAIGSRPREGRRIDSVRWRAEELTSEKLERHYAALA